MDEIFDEELGYISKELVGLVPQMSYKPNWKIWIGHDIAEDGAGGWHLFIVSDTENSLNPGERIRVRHGFLIPPASYNRDTWAAWLFERVRDIETHEAGEFFRLDGEREFAPHHSNGEDPYMVWHTSDLVTARKRAGDD